MGQPVSVLEKPSATPGVVRFETNRTFTGMGHEEYEVGGEIPGDRPPDVIARKIFEHGGVERIHINSNVVTVVLARGGSSEGIAEIIGDLYTYYRPGVPVPTAADFAKTDD